MLSAILPPARNSCSAGILPAILLPGNADLPIGALPFSLQGHGTPCPANLLGYLLTIRLFRERCHSERSVPRLCFCAKRRDTQSRNLSSMYGMAKLISWDGA